MAIDSNNDNNKDTGVEDKNYSNISNNNLDFSLAEVINNNSLLTEKYIKNIETILNQSTNDSKISSAKIYNSLNSLNELARKEHGTLEQIKDRMLLVKDIYGTLKEIKDQTLHAKYIYKNIDDNTSDKQLPVVSRLIHDNTPNKSLLALPAPSDDNTPPDKQLTASPINTSDKQLPVVSRLIYDSSIESKPKELTNENIALPAPSDDNTSDKKSPVLSKPVNDAVAEIKDEDIKKNNNPNQTGSTETKAEDIKKNNNPNQTGSTEIKDEDNRKKNNANYTGVEDKLKKDIEGNTNINFGEASLNNKTVTTLLHHLGLTKRHALKNEDFYKNFENLLTTQTLNFEGKDGISGSATLEEFIKTNLYTNITEDDSEEVKQEKAITALHNMLNGSFEEFFKDYKFASQEELEQKKEEFKENRKLLTAFYGKTLKDAATQSNQTLEQIKKQTLFGETLYKDLLDEFGNVVYEKDENGNDVAVKSDVIEFNKKAIFGAETIIDAGRLAAQDPEAYAKNVYATLKGQIGMPIQHIISDVSASLSIAKALATPIINNIKESKAYRKMRTAVIKAKDKTKEKISELVDKIKKSKTVQKIKDKGTELFDRFKKSFSKFTDKVKKTDLFKDLQKSFTSFADKVKNTDIFKKTKNLFSKFTDKVKKTDLFKSAKAKVSGLFSSVKKFFTGNKSSSKQPKDNKTDAKKHPSDNDESNKPDNNDSDDKPKPKGFFSKMLSASKKLVGDLFNSKPTNLDEDAANQTSDQKNNIVENNKKTNKAKDVVDDTEKIESEQEKLSIDKEQLSVLNKILDVLSNKSSTDKEKNKEKPNEQPEQQEQPQEQSTSVFDSLKNFMKNVKDVTRIFKGGFKAAKSGKLTRYLSLLGKRSSKTGKVIGKVGTGIISIGSKAKNLIKPALATAAATTAVAKVKNIGTGLLDKGKSKASTVFSAIKDKASTALSSGKKTGANVINKGSSVFSAIKDKASTALSSGKRAGSNIISKGAGLLSKVGNKFGGKTLAKVGAKAAGKSLLKKIPGVSILAGAAFGAGRLLKGDWKGALGEVASGVAGTIPGIGTAASLAIDGALMAKDLNDASKESEQSEQLPTEEISNKPTIKDKAKALIAQGKDKISSAVTTIKNKGPSVIDKVKSLSAKALPMISPVGSLISKITPSKDTISNAIETIKNKGSSFIDKIKNSKTLPGILPGMPGIPMPAIGNAVSTLKNKGSALIGKIKNNKKISGILSNVKNSVLPGNIISKAKSAGTNLLNKSKGLLSGIFGGKDDNEKSPEDSNNITNNEVSKNPDDGQKKPPSFLDKAKSLSVKALPMISPVGSFIKDAILNPPQVEQPSVDADETSETEQSPDAQTLNIIVNKLTELIDLQKINNDFASRPRVATSFIETNLPDMYNI